jgi:Holliday junction resolvase
MNKRRKGLRVQRVVKKYLEEKGCLVYIIHHTRFHKDIFNLFDGFYIKNGCVVFFQVKSNKKPKLEPFREFSLKYGVPVRVFVVKDRKGVFEYA